MKNINKVHSEFYQFCKERGYRGVMTIEPEYGRVIFSIRKGRHAHSQSISFGEIEVLQIGIVQYTLREMEIRMNEAMSNGQS